MIITDLNELRKPNDSASLEEAEEIIHSLELELLKHKGFGLAAPQIGIHKKVAIVRENNYSIDLVNPIIIDEKYRILIKNEGCLSIPNIHIDVWRFDEIYGKCDKNSGGFVATGLEAVVIQHEIDHLNGILIIDKTKNYNVGRNDLCPCGSRIKYKKCCYNK